MAAICELLSAGIIEKDNQGDVLWTWSYPTISSEQRELLSRKCCLNHKNADFNQFVFGQWKKTWFYIYTTETKESDRLPKIHSFSLVLTTKDYNPEKYETLCRILCKQFARSGNPAQLLECYLSVVTRGLCNNEENGTFIVKDFDVRQAYANVEIKSIIQSLGMEAILVYTALMLKKRVMVYHPKVDELLKFTRALPCLVWHRQNWDILYPYIHLEDEELKSLASQRHYVAGCTDAAVETRTDLYDLFIAVPTSEVTVAPHAKDSLAMSKLHKDVAVTMVNSAANEELSDQQVIKEIAKKTKELLNNLKTLATPNEEGVGYITLEALRERKMQPATEHFLYNLAMCEGLVQL